MESEIGLLKKFAVRVGGGISLKSIRFLPLEQESPAVRLMSALMRSDRETARSILATSDSSSWNEDFCNSVVQDRLASLIYRQIFELGLQEEFAQPSQALNLPSQLDFIKAMVVQESADFARMDSQFSYLLQNLGELRDEVVWEKGIVLSRSLYARPEFRVSGDFDLIVGQQSSQSLTAVLEKLDFKRLLDDPGHWRQLGAGPVESIEDLLLVPTPEFIPCSVLSLDKENWPMIEIKFDPLDHGLVMKEHERFYSETALHLWNGHQYRA